MKPLNQGRNVQATRWLTLASLLISLLANVATAQDGSQQPTSDSTPSSPYDKWLSEYTAALEAHAAECKALGLTRIASKLAICGTTATLGMLANKTKPNKQEQIELESFHEFTKKTSAAECAVWRKYGHPAASVCDRYSAALLTNIQRLYAGDWTFGQANSAHQETRAKAGDDYKATMAEVTAKHAAEQEDARRQAALEQQRREAMERQRAAAIEAMQREARIAEQRAANEARRAALEARLAEQAQRQSDINFGLQLMDMARPRPYPSASPLGQRCTTRALGNTLQTDCW